MKAYRLGGVGLLALVALIGSCTRSGLESLPPKGDRLRDDKLEIDGSLCTQEPESLVFPLRVLFIVDASQSMEVTDPADPVTLETRRERAVRETWQDLLNQGVAGVRIGVIRFSAQAQSRTPVLDANGIPTTYFTTDQTQLLAAGQAISITDRTTNYLNALAEAYFELRTEYLRSDLESLPLSKYVVIFLSDGLPDVDDQEARQNTTENILESVLQLRSLADLFKVGDFSFHTGYLSAGQGPAVDLPAQELLQQMAAVGGGSYRSFPSGEELNFLHIDLSIIRRVFTLRTLAVLNLNSLMDLSQAPSRPIDALDGLAFVDLDGDGVMSCGEPLVDSDGDGLADHIELRIGSDPFVADTDDDGLSDRVEWDFRYAGNDPLDPSDSTCFVPERCIDCGIDRICPGDVGYPGPDALEGDGFCDCLRDTDSDGVCNCVGDPDRDCMDAAGHDCLDTDADGWCDCPDLDGDFRCDWPDSDGDFLRDCEEIFFGTSQNGTDSDADGIPDTLEVRFRTSPIKKDDFDDLDFDLTTNGVELRAGTDALCDDSAFRSFSAYRYTIDELGLVGSSTCYDFDVSNITLVPTLKNLHGCEVDAQCGPGNTCTALSTPRDDGAIGACSDYFCTTDADCQGGIPCRTADSVCDAYPGNGWNRIIIFAGEVAFDDPSTFAQYRIACIEASYNAEGNFKNPPSGKMTVTEEDFYDVRAFDPEQHCRRPQ